MYLCYSEAMLMTLGASATPSTSNYYYYYLSFMSSLHHTDNI